MLFVPFFSLLLDANQKPWLDPTSQSAHPSLDFEKSSNLSTNISRHCFPQASWTNLSKNSWHCKLDNPLGIHSKPMAHTTIIVRMFCIFYIYPLQELMAKVENYLPLYEDSNYLTLINSFLTG
jgi:hypothetical protein